MKLLTLSLCTLVVSLMFAGNARADRWDSTGWIKLGERDVNGRVDKDRIVVGRREGKFVKLSIVVENSDMELLAFDVTFGNNQRWSPRVKHTFRDGTRRYVIDMPGDDRYIKTIDLTYKNLGRWNNAKVEVWGIQHADKGGGGHDHGNHGGGGGGWSSQGWQMLGERAVNGRVDRDRITVSAYKGRFAKLTLVVLDSDLELLDFDVKFARGGTWNPKLRHTFREGSRSHVIDLPGDERVIQYIDLKYKNTRGGGNAKIQVWAK
jgi:hypothetical protein